MRTLKALSSVLAFGVMPLSAFAQKPPAITKVEIVDRIVAQERAEIQSLRQYSPLVETYIQNFRPGRQQGVELDTDKYFLGRAHLTKGVELEPLIHSAGNSHKIFGGLHSLFSMEYIPRGFLQMIFLDENGFDRQHYNFTYIQREFLGEVRCLVFDLDPLVKGEKGRFVGRIWVEDQDYHIVRFNGKYNGSSKISYYFNFDSWRQNAGNNQWLPTFIYSEEGSGQNAPTKNIAPQSFRAQTRLWGYVIGHAREEQELSKILVETPVKDQTDAANDFSPIQAQRSWSRMAEDNVANSLERLGVMAPHGDVDKVLETVVNNLEVTNSLDIDPEVRCRMLMTSTLESFTMGHTIVVSRGLVDVLPDEGSLAAILAHELGHVVLGHRMDTQFAFFNRLHFDEKETFHHFGFARTPEEEQAANQKGVELLMHSPYKDQARTAQLFLQALQNRSKEIPNLISPHLGDRVPTDWTITSSMPVSQESAKPVANVAVALPLGGRVKVEPWNDDLQLLKSKPLGTVAEYEKMPFEIAPFVLYLTRQRDLSTEAPDAAFANPDASSEP
jgi:hypothetical protein